MIKKIMVIAPHPDDELNLIGPIVDELLRNEVSIHIVFGSYGDYCPNLTSARIKETHEAATILGLRHDNYYYLGFGDGWQRENIYQTDGVATSHAGNRITYSIAGVIEYSMIRFGKHLEYSKANYSLCIENLINDIMPDVIICVDIDSHVDHKICSLVFDEVMLKLIYNNPEYKPIVLKKFAYLSTWDGPEDFFSSIPKESSMLNSKGIILDNCSYPYNWEDRVRFQVSKDNLRVDFWNNRFYRAVSAYKTQIAKACFPRIVNSDIVYWYRDISSISYIAKITASSGECCHLNDFSVSNIRFDNYNVEKSWVPQDEKPWCMFKWDKKYRIKQVNIYIDITRTEKQLFKIKANNKIIEDILPDDKNVHTLILDNEIFANEIQFIFEGKKKIAIAEIEIFPQESLFDYSKFPMKKGSTYYKRNTGFCKVCEFLYKLDYLITVRLPNKISERLVTWKK